MGADTARFLGGCQRYKKQIGGVRRLECFR
jgi:hypothetical protein